MKPEEILLLRRVHTYPKVASENAPLLHSNRSCVNGSVKLSAFPDRDTSLTEDPSSDLPVDFDLASFDGAHELHIAALLHNEFVGFDGAQKFAVEPDLNAAGAEEAALDLALDKCGAAGDAGACHISLRSDDHLAVRLDASPEGTCDLELAQVHVGPALCTRGRLHFGADLLLRAAAEACHIQDLLARNELGELV